MGHPAWLGLQSLRLQLSQALGRDGREQQGGRLSVEEKPVLMTGVLQSPVPVGPYSEVLCACAL